MDPDSHNGVIIHLEPDTLECEVKWALGSITTIKASGGDGIQVELFQSWKMMLFKCCTQFSSVQLLSHVWFFVTPWISNHLILCCPLLLLPSIFPSIRVLSNESVLRIGWPKYWSFSFRSVLPMNTQDWFPLRWTGWISLMSKGLSRVLSNITV